MVHDSQAYRKMDVTRERISRILEGMPLNSRIAQTTAALKRLKPVLNDRSLLSVPRYD